MGKTLIIAEKPSVARDLAAILGRFEKGDGFLENSRYIVSWALGHLVELAPPEDYDPGLKRWDSASLPILPGRFKLHVISSGRKQFGVLKRLLLSAAVDEVINACDAGREGELIFRRICRVAGSTKPVKRLWLSEATPAAVKQAFGRLRDGWETDNLGGAAQARSEADWLVGINATRAFTCGVRAARGDVYSVGRVQTPTLALVVNREREIRAFRPEPYWELWATFRKETGETYRGKWTRGKEDRFIDRDGALTVAGGVTGDALVAAVEKKEVREPPPTFFNLNDLQREANRLGGLTAQATLDAAQALYEKHKLITYPRTDSRHLTHTTVRDTLAPRLAALSRTAAYGALVPPDPGTLGRRWVDDARVTDHHAIIPTAANPEAATLGKREQLVYDLVVRRFLAAFYPAARYDVTRVVTRAGGEEFISRGRVESASGWKSVYPGRRARVEEEDREDTQKLPPLARGETVAVAGTRVEEKTTKPPPRYTEATLLAAMENAGRFAADGGMADTLKETGGIGTAATRAGIIETLLKRSYLERHKKVLSPTAKGEFLIDLVPPPVKSVELTARWETGLLDVERGRAPAEGWLEGIRTFTREVVAMAAAGKTTAGPARAVGKCPLCGREVVEYPKSYGCAGYKEGCRFAVWKEVAGKKITASQAATLLAKGRTGVIKGFKSKAGKSFDAALTLGADGKVGFAFGEAEKVGLGRCPLCGKEVVEGRKGFGCSGWREGCRFTVWKEIAGKKITAAQVRGLLGKGRTGVLKGFKSREGREFTAALVLAADGRVGFDFAPAAPGRKDPGGKTRG